MGGSHKAAGFRTHRAELWALVGLCWLCSCANPLFAQCTSNAQCDDGLFCTSNICFNPGPSGQCIYPSMSCSDGLFCNGQEECDETRDVCEYACVGGTVCESGFCACNQGDGCPGGNVGAACDLFVQPPTCGFGQVCNEQLDQCTECFNNSHCTTAPRTLCNTSTGQCVQCTTNPQCQDGSFCDGTETCNTGTGLCEEGTPVDCPFGEFCSEGLFRCVECENDAQCSDGQYCTGVETCVNDECQPGTPVNCPALDPSKPHCKESSDSCVECLTDTHCNDGLSCTTDGCALDECVNTPDPLEHCDDGVFCNGAEQCNATNTGCVPGSPPICSKTCFQGINHGAACTSDSQCGKVCKQGVNVGLSCGSDFDCSKACAGGSNDGEHCSIDADCDSQNCTSRGLCATGVCRGGCSETFDQCVQCAADVAGSTSCSDGLFCDGTETCNASHVCVSAPRETCEVFNAECTKGSCNENTDSCTAVNRDDATPCDDGNECTRVEKCAAGFCVEDNPASDPYRCIRLQLVPEVAGNLGVGSTARVRLMAYADGCNVSSAVCPSNSPPIVGMEAFLAWDPQKLELQTSVLGNLNPEDPCNSSNSCFVCPAGQYNWSNDIPWPNDCTAPSPVNDPCVCQGGPNSGQSCSTHSFCDGNPDPPDYICGLQGGFSATPGNDGDLGYIALSQIGECGGNPIPACVPPGGLHVTTFKFEALAGGLGSSASVTFLPCSQSQQRLSTVVGYGSPPAGYASSDMTKTLLSTATYNIVACTVDDVCGDGDPCTQDRCVGGSCRNTPMNCTDPDLCTIDSCVNGACVHDPIQCDQGEVCYAGTCHTACSSAAECDDGVPCTIDTCDLTPPPPIDGICRHTPDDEVCDTGLFCAAQRCDATLGCVFDHECISFDGNPCADPATCDEDTDTCGGCLAPSVVASGCRFLTIDPADQGATPVALLVEGDCNDTAALCLSKYVQSVCVGGPNNGAPCASDVDCPKVCVGGTVPGTTCVTNFDCGVGGICVGYCDKTRLDDDPVYLTAAQWGEVDISGLMIRPKTKYRVMSECNFPGGSVLSAPTSVVTMGWGDTNLDGLTNVLDISTVVNYLKNLPATYEGCNVWPCEIDSTVNVTDLSEVVDAVREEPFSCSSECN